MTFKNIDAILACDPVGVIGKDGKLPWNYPEELDHFAQTTNGHVIIMGYQTYVSLPKVYCNQRTLVVFTRQNRHPTENVIFVNSMESFLSLPHIFNKQCYVIGGAQIIKLFLEAGLVNQLILTHIKYRYEGDTFFPLPLIQHWPFQQVQEFNDFIIYKYFKPIS
jgi:dihydrofolate reductase